MPSSTQLDRARIEAVVAALCDRVGGEWLLLGGGLVALWLEPRRVTEDVDLVPVSGESGARLQLMKVADELGLPVEAVNSAADFFVSRIPDWRAHLAPFRSGALGRVYRPSATLFLLLKVPRLSEHDLADCLALLRRVLAEGLPADVQRVASVHRAEKLEGRGRLEDIVVLTGHAPIAPLPSREELYDEAFDAPGDEAGR